MADGLNRVTLLGSLGADCETRVTQGGTTVVNMRLATNSSYLNREGVRQERVDWHSLVWFGKRAEALARHLTKGTKLYVEGELRTESWEKDGEKRYATKVHVSNVIFAGGGSRGGGEDEGGAERGYGGDDRGQGQSRGGGGRQQRQSAPRGDDGYGPPGGGGGGGGYSRGGGNGGGAARAPAAQADPEPGFGEGAGDGGGFGADDEDIPF